MAKVVPITLSIEEFLPQRLKWGSKRQLRALYGLSNEALTLRLRSFRGNMELLTVLDKEGFAFMTRLYKRSQVHAAIRSFTRRRGCNRADADTLKWLDAREAAVLLGFSHPSGFNKWFSFCERKPKRRKKWRNFPSGKARRIFVYEKESLLECRNWFLQRKRQEDRLPSLKGSCGQDPFLSGVEVCEHMGYSRKEYMNR